MGDQVLSRGRYPVVCMHIFWTQELILSVEVVKTLIMS